jgi:hypothetical protein
MYVVRCKQTDLNHSRHLNGSTRWRWPNGNPGTCYPVSMDPPCWYTPSLRRLSLLCTLLATGREFSWVIGLCIAYSGGTGRQYTFWYSYSRPRAGLLATGSMYLFGPYSFIVKTTACTCRQYNTSATNYAATIALPSSLECREPDYTRIVQRQAQRAP